MSNDNHLNVWLTDNGTYFVRTDSKTKSFNNYIEAKAYIESHLMMFTLRQQTSQRVA